MAKKIPMTREAARRIRAAAQNNPDSRTAQQNFADWADRAAIRNEQGQRTS